MSASPLIANFPRKWFADAHEKGEQTMLLIDGAARGDMLRTVYELENTPECVPLFYQERFKFLIDVGPSIIPVCEDSPITRWFLDNNLFLDNGFFFCSKHTPLEVAHSLIPCLEASNEDEESLLFRFYDPLVLSALLLDGLTLGISRIAERISGFLINYFDRNNQNLWGSFQKIHQKHVGETNTTNIVIDLEYMRIFDSNYTQRMINKHAIACSRLYSKDLLSDTVIQGDITNPAFTIARHYADKSIYVSDALFDETSTRLALHEKSYQIENFDYLAKCDLLLLQAVSEGKVRMHEALLQTDTFIGDRIYLCEKILENEYGGK